MDKNENTMITFEMVADLLRNFRQLKQKESQLEFEISNYKAARISSEDIIETMTFDHSAEHIKGGQPSDRTAAIAIAYNDKRYFINIKQKVELEDELANLQNQIRRIEFYIDILEPRYSCVLRDLYIEGYTFEGTAIKEHISITAVKNNRRAGIKKLVKMLQMVSK